MYDIYLLVRYVKYSTTCDTISKRYVWSVPVITIQHIYFCLMGNFTIFTKENFTAGVKEVFVYAISNSESSAVFSQLHGHVHYSPSYCIFW